ncbi:hypothetical protein [Isoptericola aurantiacus]|uniref:hypothetical protein n=1 Tax=Isoptericola aurantiacus TaxID=3377839 RepID=UPI00383BCA19
MAPAGLGVSFDELASRVDLGGLEGVGDQVSGLGDQVSGAGESLTDLADGFDLRDLF